MIREPVGQILIKEGKLDENLLNQALDEQKKNGDRLECILVKNGYVKEKDILNAFSHQFNIPVISLSNQKIDEVTARKIPAKFAYRYRIIPIRQENNHLVVAVTDPFNLHALDDLRLFLECNIKAVLCSEKELFKVLKNIYGVGAETMEQLSVVEGETGENDTEEITKVEEKSPEDASIIKFILTRSFL